MSGGTGLKQWSAPETRQRSFYGKEIDSWSIGCMLYCMITGNEPFNPNLPLKSAHQTLMGQINEENSVF